MQCSYIKEDGKQCEANSMTGSDFCFSHNPKVAEEKRAAVLKGGLSSKLRKDPQTLSPIKINKAEDILSLLEDTINRVRIEPMTHQKANSVGYLANIALKAIEISDLEKRIDNLEKSYENKI